MYPTRRQLVAGLSVAGLVALGILLSPGDALAAIRSHLYSPWFPLMLVGCYLVRPLLAWPITAISVLVGYRYGLIIGVPVALFGAVGTSLLPYALGRYSQRHNGALAGLIAGSRRFFDATGGLRGLIAVRLAPTPAEPVSIAAGTGGVAVVHFVVGTAIGELPWTIAAVLAGYSLNRLSVAPAAVVNPWLVAGGLLAASLLLTGPAYRWLRRSQRDRIAS